MTESLLPRLPERVGKIKVDLTGTYPRRKGSPEDCEVEVYRVPTERELYGSHNVEESTPCVEK